jgi:hypothetical protein
MAAKKGTGNATSTAASATDAGNQTTSTTPTSSQAAAARRRGPNDPDATIYWNGARDKALMTLLLTNPGRLTSTQVAERLAQDPSFADEKHLLARESAPDKIRQRVVKLNKVAQGRGLGALELRRLNNSGYDMSDTVDEVFAQMQMQQGQGQGGPGQTYVESGNSVPVEAQGSGAGGLVPSPEAQAQTQATQGQVQLTNVPTTTIAQAPQFPAGGLIPTPQ